MAKNDTGLKETDMVDLTADPKLNKEVQSEAEHVSEEQKANLAKVLGQDDSLVTPNSVINLAQKARRHAILTAIAEDPENAAIVMKDVIKDYTQTATQQLRANAESEGNKAIAAAIAANNYGVTNKKSPDEKVDKSQTKTNPVKDLKLNFGNEVTEQEISTKIESPDYEELMKLEAQNEMNARANPKSSTATAPVIEEKTKPSIDLGQLA